jgi:hypothetical protein
MSSWNVKNSMSARGRFAEIDGLIGQNGSDTSVA